MSFHIVHILTEGSFLHIDRGCLVCGFSNQTQKRLPLKDILAVIVATQGVGFSEGCISKLLENKAVILHCDDKYKPIGLSSPLFSVIHPEIFERQISFPKELNQEIWKSLIKAKVQNQVSLLSNFSIKNNLSERFDKNKFEEGNTARYYWSIYFKQFDNGPNKREHKEAHHIINQALNYGYAVLKALLHRSIIIHGLNPSLGLHHCYRFRVEPLLYDLIEPLRPICDWLLLKFYFNNNKFELKDWAKYFASNLSIIKLEIPNGKKIKLLNAIDYYCSTVADCFIYSTSKRLFIPLISKVILEDNAEQREI